MSDDISELVSNPTSDTGCYDAVVTVAPVGETDPMVVTLKGNDQVVGPCPWVLRGEDLPAQGDLCWVTFSDSNTPVVILWWPSDQEGDLYG